MKRYFGIDIGKSATKYAEYLPKEGITLSDSFRTKVSEGDFRDDALEKDTVIIEIDGKVYKVGNGALRGAKMETSKQSITHKIGLITAFAKNASVNEIDDIYFGTGIPAKEWAVVNKRVAFKDFLFPNGDTQEFHVRIKKTATGPIEEKTFRIHKTPQGFIFPESIGGLMQDDSPKVISSRNAVLDIGGLNVNATVWDEFELQQQESLTNELGSNTLVKGLADELSAKFTRCNIQTVESILCKKPEYRYLQTGDEKLRQETFDFIADYLLNHARKIHDAADAKGWDEWMPIVALGGTSLILKNELETVFKNIVFIKNPTFANAYGYLRMLLSRLPETENAWINLSSTPEKKKKKDEESGEAA